MTLKKDTISATLRVELKPWIAPNFASRISDGDGRGGSIPVKELDDDTLEDMALAWVRDLYAKAGRSHAPFYKPAKDGNKLP